MSNLSFNAGVSGVKFFTNSKGVLVPIITLDKEYTARKGKDVEKFDGITMSSYKELVSKEIGKGAVVHINFDDKLMPTITDVIKTAKAPNPPTNCLYCNSRIVHVPQGDQLCVNHLCPAQGRTGIFKLIIGCSLEPLQTDAIITIHKWLNTFPCNQDVAEVSYYYEFLKLFHQELDKVGQVSRHKELKDRFGDAGGYLYLLEVNLKNSLQAGIKPTIIWNSLSLPFSENDIKKVSDYDFNTKGKKGLPKLSEHGRKVVESNLRHIELIFAETSRFANK